MDKKSLGMRAARNLQRKEDQANELTRLSIERSRYKICLMNALEKLGITGSDMDLLLDNARSGMLFEFNSSLDQFSLLRNKGLELVESAYECGNDLFKNQEEADKNVRNPYIKVIPLYKVQPVKIDKI